MKRKRQRRKIIMKFSLRKRKKDDGLNAIFSDLSESKEEAEKLGYDITKLHCKDCIYLCALSEARCQNGKKAAAFLSSYAKING